MPIKHKKQSVIPDSPGNEDEVKPSNWNDDHDIQDYLELPIPTAPVSPPLSGLRMFPVSRANRVLPSFVGPSGLDSPLQPAIFANRVAVITPNRTSSLNHFGCGSQLAATVSHQSPVAGSMAQSLYRARFQTSTTAGNASGVRSDPQVFRGNGGTSRGGFFHAARFCTGSTALLGSQWMVGLQGAASALAGQPSALTNSLFVGMDSGDTNLQFMRNDGAGVATKQDLGIAYEANIAINLRVFCPPSSPEVWVLVERINDNGSVNVLLADSYTTDIPAETIGLCMHCQIRNGALTAASNIEMVQLYLESDY